MDGNRAPVGATSTMPMGQSLPKSAVVAEGQGFESDPPPPPAHALFSPSTASLYKPGCDGVNLRTSASTSGTIKTKAYLGTQLTVAGSVSGGSWSAVCPTSKSGSGWYKVTAINGSSVSSLYGVGVLYAATGVLVPIQ